MAIFSLTNCTKKNLVPEADSSYFSIFANFEQTRTSADAFGKASWVDGDAINVYFKSGSEYVNCGKYVIEDALTGKFVGKLTDEIRGKLGETNDWYFYYPYSEDRKSPESTDAEEGWVVGCDANVPLVQSTINDMSHLDGKNFPLYGITKGVAKDATPSATMKHIASLLAIGIRNEYSQDIDILRVEFNTQNNYIAGKFSVDFSQEPLYLHLKSVQNR